MNITKYAMYKKMFGGKGGGSGTTIRNQNKIVTENGVYSADSGYTGLGTVTVIVPNSITEISTATEMDTILANATSADIGKAYMYVGGTTEKYENNAIYLIKEN